MSSATLLMIMLLLLIKAGLQQMLRLEKIALSRRAIKTVALEAH